MHVKELNINVAEKRGIYLQVSRAAQTIVRHVLTFFGGFFAIVLKAIQLHAIFLIACEIGNLRISLHFLLGTGEI